MTRTSATSPSVRGRRWTLLIVATLLATAACDSGSGVTTTSARELARRLDDAGVCTETRPSSPQESQQARTVGMTATWVCLAPLPGNGAHGGIEVGLWAGRSAAQKQRVLHTLLAELHDFCSSSGARVSQKGSASPDGTTSETVTTVRPAGAEVTSQYVEGDNWLALVGINARFHRVAATLHGRAVTKHCS